MASKKQRVEYIVNWCKAHNFPSEVCIAILCNIKAESGFNPKAVESGFNVPPYTHANVGYGLFQFSDYPQNQQLYTHCKNMSDLDAINYQMQVMYNECTTTDINKLHWFKRSHNGVNYNLSFKDFYKNTQNKSAEYLTYAFQWEYLRPGTEQNRYKLFASEIKKLYDFSKYDKNGEHNITNGIIANEGSTDCGGQLIKHKQTNAVAKPTTPTDTSGIPTPMVASGIAYLKKWADKGHGGAFDDGFGFQCVAMVEHYLKMVDKDFIPGAHGNGNEYVAHFNSLGSGHKWANLSPKKWVKAKPPYKKGDVLAYNVSPPNHVAVAYSSTQRLAQNEELPSGAHNKIYLVPIGKPNSAIRKIKD